MTDAIAQSLRDVLDGRWIELRRRAREELPADIMLAPPGLTMEEHRTRTTESLLQIAQLGYGRIGFPAEFGGELDYAASCVLFEMQAYGDLSLLVKGGVQFGLFGGAVARLGTRRHHAAYLEDVMTVAVNLVGIPAISLPLGMVEGLPVGLQLMAPHVF